MKVITKILTLVNPLVPQIFLLNFCMKVLQKLPFCEKITHEKFFLEMLNGNQDINDLRFLVFLTVHSYLMIFSDAHLAVDSLVPE